MKPPVNVFFLGKGGVGKSTSSALYAVRMAGEGHRVLLVSMDPAHNLSDIFGRKLSDKPSRIIDGLSVIELDEEKWINRYLSDIRLQIKKNYTYLTAFNLDGYFDLIRFSPGLEEYALVLAFQEIRRSFADHDFLIFDMPPTALSLRFLSLPSLSLVWTEKLQALRQAIIKKKEMITRIKLLNKERETDKVLNKLEEQQQVFRSLRALFKDSEATKIKLVMNPDPLSFAESERIRDHLDRIRLRIDRILFNKLQGDEPTDQIKRAFPDIEIERIPWNEIPLNSLDRLRSFLETHSFLG